jgi:hypothetical protein
MDNLNADCRLRIDVLADSNCELPEREGVNSQVRRSAIRNLQSAFGYLLAVAGLIWVLRDIQPAKLLGQLININWRWIALAAVCDLRRVVHQ